ncbi:MAG: RNA polymerase sigma-70 factor [Niabella sp.]
MQYDPSNRENNLLEQVAQGNEVAFRQLYDHYRDKVYSLGMHLTRSEYLAEEIVQEVFLKTWTKREELQHIDYFNSWLRTVTRNTCIDYLRSAEIENKVLALLAAKIENSIRSAEDEVLSREYDQVLLEAIRQLPPQRQKIYLLSRQQGLKQEEIARQLNISVYTVKEHIKLALKSIRAYLEKRIYTGLMLLIAILWH